MKGCNMKCTSYHYDCRQQQTLKHKQYDQNIERITNDNHAQAQKINKLQGFVDEYNKFKQELLQIQQVDYHEKMKIQQALMVQEDKIKDLESQLLETQQKNRKLNQIVESSEIQKEHYENEYEQLLLQRQDRNEGQKINYEKCLGYKDKQIIELQNKVVSLEFKVEKKEQEIKTLKESFKKKEGQKDQEMKELKKILENTRSTGNSLKIQRIQQQHEDQKKKMEQQNQSLFVDNQKCRKEKEYLQKENSKLNETIDQIKDLSNSFRYDFSDVKGILESKILTLEKEKDQMQEQINQQNELLNQYTEQLEKNDVTMNKFKLENTNLVYQQKQLQNNEQSQQIEQLRAKLQDREERLIMAEKTIDKLNNEQYQMKDMLSEQQNLMHIQLQKMKQNQGMNDHQINLMKENEYLQKKLSVYERRY